MFEEIPAIIIFLLFSLVVSYLLMKYIPEPFKKIIVGLMMVGIIIHEFFHVVMCIITNTPIKNIKFLEITKTERESNYKKYEFNGCIMVKGENKMTFLQALLVGLAPLLFSFWICFLLLDFVVHPRDELSFFLSFFIILSIMFSAAPSSTDLINIPNSFINNPKYSAYQIVLLILSIFIVWIILSNLYVSKLHEIFIYLMIMVFYYIWKYSFKFINSMFHLVNSSRKLKLKH